MRLKFRNSSQEATNCQALEGLSLILNTLFHFASNRNLLLIFFGRKGLLIHFYLRNMIIRSMHLQITQKRSLFPVGYFSLLVFGASKHSRTTLCLRIAAFKTFRNWAPVGLYQIHSFIIASLLGKNTLEQSAISTFVGHLFRIKTFLTGI